MERGSELASVSGAVPFRVFVNYRREDTSGHAGRLYDSLTSRLGPNKLFMDIDTIEPGTDFTEVIDEAIDSAQAVIVLIGPRWATVTDRTGRRRLDAPRDWVRLEIENALRKNVRVIPVLVGNAEMPPPDELPDSIERLSRLNAIELSDSRWHSDVGRLAALLERVETAAREAATSTVEDPETAMAAGDAASEPHTAVVPPPPAGALEPARPARPRRHRRTLAVAIAGIAIVVGVALAMALGGEGGSGDGGSPTRASSSRDGLQWQRVSAASFGGQGEQAILRGAIVQRSLVLVGSTTSQGDLDAVVWMSDDGRSWSPRGVIPRHEPGDQELFAVGLGEPAFLAAGYDGSGEDLDAAMWGSPDGINWTRIDPARFRRAGDQRIYRLSNIGGTIIAVGFDASTGDRDAAAWILQDDEWVLADADALRSDGDQEMRGMVQFSGSIVGVGFTAEADAGDAAAWILDDDTWRRIDSDAFAGPGEQRMLTVKALGPGLVAVGYSEVDGERDGAVWTSPDGDEWTRVESPELGGAGPQEVIALTRWGSGMLATGYDDEDAAVWTSDDGSAWTKQPTSAALGGPGQQRMRTVIPFRDALIGAGTTTSDAGDSDAAVWVADQPS